MEAKRIEIAEKVCKLYREYGIKSVTMDDVSRSLGISKKTLYTYFTDKRDLVLGVMEVNEHNRAIDFSVPQKENTNAIEELFFYYKIQVQMIKDHKPSFIYDLKKYYPDLFQSFQEKKRMRILENVRKNLIKGKKEGLFRNDLDESVISRLNLMRIEGIMNSTTFKLEEIVTPEFFSEVFKYHVYGILNDKGRKLFNEKIHNLNNA